MKNELEELNRMRLRAWDEVIKFEQQAPVEDVRWLEGYATGLDAAYHFLTFELDNEEE